MTTIARHVLHAWALCLTAALLALCSAPAALVLQVTAGLVGVELPFLYALGASNGAVIAALLVRIEGGGRGGGGAEPALPGASRSTGHRSVDHRGAADIAPLAIAPLPLSCDLDGMLTLTSRLDPDTIPITAAIVDRAEGSLRASSTCAVQLENGDTAVVLTACWPEGAPVPEWERAFQVLAHGVPHLPLTTN